MKDIYSPGIQNSSEDASYKPALYSNKAFEKLTASLPLFGAGNAHFNQLLSDLQGNILAHHNRKFTDCYLFHFKENSGERNNTQEALQWIQAMAQHLTTAGEQFPEEILYRKSKRAFRRKPVCCFYLTWEGYSRLGLEHLAPFDHKDAFQKGMRERNPALFNTASPNKIWDKKEDVHALLMIADDERDAAAGDFVAGIFGTSDMKKVAESGSKGSDIGWAFVTRQSGFLKRNDKGAAVEWFGFRDGISQPLFFPDPMRVQQFQEDDLSPLRVVLVKDRGGNNEFSAGSFMAFLKIRQDVKAFEAIERTIAGYTTFYGIESLISKKRIEDVITKTQVSKLIRVDEAAKRQLITDFVKIVRIPVDRVDAVEDKIRQSTLKPAIINLILENEVRKLFSIKKGETAHVFEAIRAKVDEIFETPGKPADFGALCDTYNKSTEILDSRAAIAFVNDEVITKIMKAITKGLQVDDVQKGVLKVAIDKIFSIDEDEKKKLIEAVAKDPLPLITPREMKDMMERSKALAGAYVIGRFKDGTPVSLSPNPAAFPDKRTYNDFSYHKNYVSNGTTHTTDGAGMRCPFAAHIRKADPRDEQQTRLIARRGVLYNDDPKGKNDPNFPPGDEAGMLFMCFQSNLAEQFEYIVKNWMNSVQFGKQATGVDMLAGAGRDRNFSRWYIPLEWGGADANEKVLLTAAELEPCIEYLWGEYFFAPSVSFLQRITRFNHHDPPNAGVRSGRAAAPPAEEKPRHKDIAPAAGIVDNKIKVKRVSLLNDRAIAKSGTKKQKEKEDKSG